jgi:hypothetical protein
MLCSPLKVVRRLGGRCNLHSKVRRLSQSRIQQAGPKMVTYSSETSLDFQQTTTRHIPEGIILTRATARISNLTTNHLTVK